MRCRSLSPGRIHGRHRSEGARFVGAPDPKKGGFWVGLMEAMARDVVLVGLGGARQSVRVDDEA